MSASHILDQLYKVLQERKNATVENSYVFSLYSKGSSKIAEKILEEAQEVIVKARGKFQVGMMARK